MKHILLLMGVVALLMSTGCIFPGGHHGGGEYHDGGEYHGHGEYREHSEYRSYPEPGVVIKIHPD